MLSLQRQLSFCWFFCPSWSQKAFCTGFLKKQAAAGTGLSGSKAWLCVCNSSRTARLCSIQCAKKGGCLQQGSGPSACLHRTQRDIQQSTCPSFVSTIHSKGIWLRHKIHFSLLSSKTTTNQPKEKFIVSFKGLRWNLYTFLIPKWAIAFKHADTPGDLMCRPPKPREDFPVTDQCRIQN